MKIWQISFYSIISKFWSLKLKIEARLERSDSSSLHPLDLVFLWQTAPVSCPIQASLIVQHLGLVLLFTSFELKLRGNDKLVVVSKLQQLAPCFPSLRYGKLRA